jgi:hypothetical protein
MANRERLDADATLRSVLSTLDDSLTFVRKTFGVVNSYTRTHGQSFYDLELPSKQREVAQLSP